MGGNGTQWMEENGLEQVTEDASRSARLGDVNLWAPVRAHVRVLLRTQIFRAVDMP